MGTVIDITESKRSEEALRASEQVARGQVEALAQSLDVLATAPEPEKFIGQMLSTIGRLLNAQSVTLWLFDESADSLVLRSMSDGGKLGRARSGASIHEEPVVLEAERNNPGTALHGRSGRLRRRRRLIRALMASGVSI